MFKTLTHTNINSTDNTPINGGHKQQINLRVPCRQNIYTAQPQHAAAWEAPVVQARHGRERSLRTRSNVHGPPRAWRRRSARYDGLGAPDQQRGVRGSGHLRGARLRAPPGCAAQGTAGVRGSGHLGLGLEDDLALEEVLGVERRGALRVAGRVRVHLNQPYP